MLLGMHNQASRGSAAGSDRGCRSGSSTCTAAANAAGGASSRTSSAWLRILRSDASELPRSTRYGQTPLLTTSGGDLDTLGRSANSIGRSSSSIGSSSSDLDSEEASIAAASAAAAVASAPRAARWRRILQAAGHERGAQQQDQVHQQRGRRRSSLSYGVMVLDMGVHHLSGLQQKASLVQVCTAAISLRICRRSCIPLPGGCHHVCPQ
jgi:hypothetical protein